MKKKLQIILFTFILTLGVFLFNYAFPSMLNGFNQKNDFWDYRKTINHEHLRGVYLLHVDWSVFATRPLTSYLISLSHDWLKLSYGNSFVLVNFGFLFLSGLTLYFLFLKWENNQKHAYLSVFLFFASFTVLYSYISSNYTYDEPAQYFFIFLSLLAATDKKWPLFNLAFFLSLIARESTVLLVPGLLAFFFFKQERKNDNYLYWRNYRKNSLILVLSIVAFFAFSFVFARIRGIGNENSQYFETERFVHLFYNFQNKDFSIESVLLFFLSLGIPLVLLVHYYLNKQNKNNLEKRSTHAFLISLLVNTFVVYVATRAREMRLFALPLFFLWPMLGKYTVFLASSFILKIKEIYTLIKIKKFIQIILSLLFLVIMEAVFYSLSFKYYNPTADGNFEISLRIYAFFFLTFLSVYVSLFLNPLLKNRKLD